MSLDVMIDDICLLQLRANDFDWGGHLNNSVYFQLFEYGRWSWARNNGFDLKNSSLVAVVIQANVDFIKPVEWNPLGQVDVVTSLHKIGPYSISLNQRVISDNIVFADAKIRLSILNIATNKILNIDLEGLKRDFRT